MLIKKYISEILTASFIAAFLWYGFENRTIFEDLKNIALGGLLLVGVGKLVVLFSNALFTKWSTEAFTKKLTLGEGTYLGVLSGVGNFFGPIIGGTSIRALYLKKYHNLTYSNFTSTLMGYYLILFLSYSFIAIISLFFIPASDQKILLLFIFGVLFIVLGSFIFIRLPKRERFSSLESNKYSKKILKIIFDIENGWQVLVNNKRLLLRLFIVAWISIAGTIFVTVVEFHIFDIESSFAVIGLYSSIVALSLLISLTPGAIGIREAMLIFIGSTLALSNEQILQIAVVDRGVQFILLIVLFLIIRIPKIKSLLTGGKETV